MHKAFTSVFVSFICFGSVQAQEYFSVLPDMGGHDGQAQTFLIMPYQEHFVVIGDYIDSSLIGLEPGIWPWLAKFDYEGTLLHNTVLVDTSYSYAFHADHYSSILKNDSTLYYYAYRDMGGDYFTSYLLEIDLLNATLTRSKLLSPPVGDHFATCAVTYNGIDELAVANILWRGDTNSVFITRLDTSFNVIQSIEVNGNIEPKRHNIPQHIAFADEGSFILIGESRRDGVADFDTADIFYMRVDTTGTILDSRLAPTSVHLRFVWAFSYTVLKDELENWIISAGELLGIDSCWYCRQYVPYMLSVSPEFDSVNWEIRFSDIPIHPRIQHVVHSSAECSDGFVSAGFRISSIQEIYPSTGLLFKASKEGDSLWMRHYIPVGWDSTRASWIEFNDIKTTANDNLIVAGTIADRELGIVRAWLLQLDKDGCLVPGCNDSVDVDDTEDDKHNLFRMYPNPATSEIYLLGLSELQGDIRISIIDMTGRALNSTLLHDLSSGAQYIIPVEHLQPGGYILRISTSAGKILEQHKFLHQ